MSTIIETSDADVAPSFDGREFWRQFQHRSIVLKGVRLHFVEGGKGEPVVLLPGWPQSWYAWRYVMPLLTAAGRKVIALDPRGLGDSDRPESGYDMRTVAAELHEFLNATSLLAHGPVDIVGHDIGTWIGHALAVDWPNDVRRLALFDASIPGVTPPLPGGIPSAEANVKSWHFAFNRLPDLPELLLQGREREFLTWLFKVKSARAWTITADDLDEYVRIASAPGGIRSGLNYYRQNLDLAGLEASRARAEQKMSIPILAYGADGGVGDRLRETMALVAEKVSGGVFSHCGHYMPEEAPRPLATQILSFINA